MKSIASRIIPVAAVAVSLFCFNGVARADALPPDACGSVSDVGQSCSNAGASNDESGVCVAETCHSASPPDGGSSYACALCEVPDGGTPTADAGPSSDAGPTGDGGQATTVRDDAGTDASSGSSSSSGCSASPDASDGATGFAMLALGIVGLAFGRRRKS